MSSFNASAASQVESKLSLARKRLLSVSQDNGTPNSSSSESVDDSHSNNDNKKLDYERKLLKKQPIKSRIGNSYPRRRALTACQTCRRKKIKCDNVRPICGNCQALQQSSLAHLCLYDDSKQDLSSFDRPTIEILSRLTDIQTKLAQISRPETDGLVQLVADAALQQATTHGVSPLKSADKFEALLANSASKSTGNWNCSAEWVLGWPQIVSQCPNLPEQHRISVLLNQLSAQGQCRNADFKVVHHMIHDASHDACQSTLNVNLQNLPNLNLANFAELSRFEQQLFSMLDDSIHTVFVKKIYPQMPFLDLTRICESVDYLVHAYRAYTNSHNNSSFLLTHSYYSNLFVPLPLVLLCFAMSVYESNKQGQNSLDQLYNCRIGNTAFKVALQLQQILEDSLIVCETTPEPQTWKPEISFFQKNNPKQTYSLWTVQVNLLCYGFKMLAMQPLHAWSYLQKACTGLLTYSEVSHVQYRLVSADEELLTIPQLYWICYKLESQMKVQLSPFFVSLGILDYYFSPRMPSKDFYGQKYTIDPLLYTEIHLVDSLASTLAKIEVSLLNVLYTCSPGSRSLEDQWDSFDASFCEDYVTYFLNRIQGPIKALLLDSLRNQIVHSREQDSPEFVRNIRWKIASIKLKVYLPLVYCIMNNNVEETPFVSKALEDFFSLVFSNTDFAFDTTRSETTWFRLRDSYLSAVLVILLTNRFPDKYATQSKAKGYLKRVADIFSFWKFECPEFAGFLQVLTIMGKL